MVTDNILFCPVCYFPTADLFPKRTHDGRDIIDVEFEDISSESDLEEPAPIPEFHVGDRVIVSATATGTGEDIPGSVSMVETFLGEPIVTVDYDYPSSDGIRGKSFVNLRLITKKIKPQETAKEVKV